MDHPKWKPNGHQPNLSLFAGDGGDGFHFPSALSSGTFGFHPYPPGMKTWGVGMGKGLATLPAPPPLPNRAEISPIPSRLRNVPFPLADGHLLKDLSRGNSNGSNANRSPGNHYDPLKRFDYGGVLAILRRLLSVMFIPGLPRMNELMRSKFSLLFNGL